MTNVARAFAGAPAAGGPRVTFRGPLWVMNVISGAGFPRSVCMLHSAPLHQQWNAGPQCRPCWELRMQWDTPYIKHAADATVACPHRGTSMEGVNHRKLNSEAVSKVL